MNQILSLFSFVFILWVLFGMDLADENKKKTKEDGGNFLVTLFGGILISPFLALGGFLFILGRIAMAIPAILYGILILCGRVMRGLWEQVKVLLKQLSGLAGRIERNAEKLLTKVGLRRSLDQMVRFFKVAGSRLVTFLRESSGMILRFLVRLFREILRVAGRIMKNMKRLATAIGGRSVRRNSSFSSSSREKSSIAGSVKNFFFSSSSSSRGNRSTSSSGKDDRAEIKRSSSASWLAWLFAPFLRKGSERDRRTEAKRRTVQEEKKNNKRSSWHAPIALLLASLTRKRDDERKSEAEEPDRTAVGRSESRERRSVENRVIHSSSSQRTSGEERRRTTADSRRSFAQSASLEAEEDRHGERQKMGRRLSEDDVSGGASTWNWRAMSRRVSGFFTRRRASEKQERQNALDRREAATHRVHGTRFSEKTSSVSSVFRGHLKEGKVIFKRMEHPAASRNIDVMEDLRKVGRHTRRRLHSIE